MLIERGLTPPALGIASFGDLPFPTLSLTGVTIVPLPARLLDETAAKPLIGRITVNGQPARTIILGNEG